MTKLIRPSVVIPLLLACTMAFWTAILLFQFRILNVFDAILMKVLGPTIIFGIMALFPVAAVILGIRKMRTGPRRMLDRVGLAVSGLLIVAFAFFLAIPLVLKALEPRTPKNPAVPRPIAPQTGLAVFPGAEGFGTRTPAGRGGKVIEVTSLADAGPGTLRAALDDPAPRIVVFRVGGTIALTDGLFIKHPFVTVAGQTAPGGGIAVKNAGLTILTHDVLVQHLRIRPGNEGAGVAEDNDAISILGRHGTTDGAFNVVLDHISASWSEDEVLSTWYGAHDVTISWSIVSEALNRSRHRKQTHSAGLLIGDSSEHVSVHHTLLAHNDFRNPLIIDGGTHDIVNNVIYDWGALPAEVVDRYSNSFLNFVGNTFIPGPSTRAGPMEILINPNKGTPRLHVTGNRGPHRPDHEYADWALVGYGFGEKRADARIYGAAAAYPVHVVLAKESQEAFEEVLSHAGATRPGRDAVDQRIVTEVTHRSGAIIDSPDQVGGYPRLEPGTPPADRDHDGMPDPWEVARGLDPADAADAALDRDGDGYTNVEEYLHSLLSEPAQEKRGVTPEAPASRLR